MPLQEEGGSEGGVWHNCVAVWHNGVAQRSGTALAVWLLVPADDHRGAARGLEAAQAGSGPTPAGLVGGSDLFRSFQIIL